MKNSFKHDKYKYLYYNKQTKEHILLDKDTNIREIWIANKEHASAGLTYKNTHLEFCSTWK